jgi:hypothetical protein
MILTKFVQRDRQSFQVSYYQSASWGLLLYLVRNQGWERRGLASIGSPRHLSPQGLGTELADLLAYRSKSES